MGGIVWALVNTVVVALLDVLYGRLLGEERVQSIDKNLLWTSAPLSPPLSLSHSTHCDLW